MDKANSSNQVLADEIFKAQQRRRLYAALLFGCLAVILVAGYERAERLSSGSFWAGIWRIWDFPAQSIVEAWEKGIVNQGFLMMRFLPALFETLNIALFATLLGAAIGLFLSFCASNNSGVPKAIVIVTRRLLDLFRAFPELVIALFLIFLLGASPIPAMIAITVHTVGVCGKLFSEVNENVDMSAFEGMTSVGASWIQRIRYGIVPEALPAYISYALLRLEINVRASAILGFVGAGGIGAELRRTIGWGQGLGDQTIALFLLLLFSIVLIDLLSSFIRRRVEDLRSEGVSTRH